MVESDVPMLIFDFNSCFRVTLLLCQQFCELNSRAQFPLHYECFQNWLCSFLICTSMIWVGTLDAILQWWGMILLLGQIRLRPRRCSRLVSLAWARFQPYCCSQARSGNACGIVGPSLIIKCCGQWGKGTEASRKRGQKYDVPLLILLWKI